MNDNDFTYLLEPAIEIAEQAGEKILDIYATDFKVDIKQDKSPLTEADLASHNRIVEGLNALEPRIPIIPRLAGCALVTITKRFVVVSKASRNSMT